MSVVATSNRSSHLKGVGMSFLRRVLPITLLLIAACDRPPTAVEGPMANAGPGGRPSLVGWGTNAPVALENASSASANAGSLAWWHSVGSGANRFLTVGVSIRNAANTVRSVSYAGQALTFLGARSTSDGAVRVELWTLGAPPSGTAKVVVTLSGTTKVVGGAESFTGVDPTSPMMAGASAASGDPATSASLGLGMVAGGMAVSFVGVDGVAGTLTPATGQSRLWTRFTGAGSGDVAGGASATFDASVMSLGWVMAGKARWAVGGVILNPVTTGDFSAATTDDGYAVSW